MKKILLFLFLAMPLMGYAQKSYLHLLVFNASYEKMESDTHGHRIYITGDIPSGVKDFYSSSSEDMTVGTLMSLLSEKGYELEKAFSLDTSKEIIIMSKNGSSSYSKIQNVRIEDDREPYEVARYNLQGMPVKKTEKGIQIIVFSNYTTKTVIVE